MKTNLKKLMLTTLITIAANSALAYEKDGLQAVIEGRSDYLCTLNRANPKEPMTYDQRVFSIGYSESAGSEVIVVTRDGAVMPFEMKQGIQPDELKRLTGATLIGFQVTPEVQARSEMQRNLTISISTFGDPMKAKPNVNLIKGQVLASGYYKGSVMVVNETRKMLVTCWHKAILHGR